MVERSIQGMVIIQDLGVVYCNQAFAGISGYSKKELLSLTPTQVEKMVHPDDRDLIWGRMKKRLQGKKVLPRYEFKGFRKDGSVRWLEMLANRIEYEGKPAILGSIIDITERKKAQDKLIESEEKFKVLFEHTPDAYYLSDIEGTFIDGNRAAEKLIGFSRNELLGKNILKLKILSEEQLPKATALLANNALGKATGPDEFDITRRDGTMAVIEIRTYPVKIKNETFILGLVKNITENKNTQKALRESEEKYRAIFESFHDVYYRTDRDGIVTIISPSVRTHAGWDPEDIIGHPVTDFYKDPPQRELFKEKLKESGVINDYELKLLAKDGRVMHVSVSSKIILGNDGKPTGVEGVLRDITDRKRAEEQIRSSLRDKEVLLQEIHHRVKNNMQIISSLLNLQSRHIEDERVKDMFRMSRNRIRSMALIHEKLYQSKDLAKINFAQYIESLAVHLLQTYNASTDRIKLNADVSDVFLDINKAIPCGLIVNELVSNSLKHAFPKHRRGNIYVQLRNGKNGDVHLMVSDNGIGLSEEVDFKKPDSMGLQLVKDLIDQLEGTLELSLNAGTTYQISFSK